VVWDGFIIVERVFQILRNICSNLHIVFGILSLQKAYYFVEIFLLQLFHSQASMFFYTMMAFSASLFIIILFGDFLVGKFISVSFVLSNNIWVVCSQLLSVEGILSCLMEVKVPLMSHGLLK